MTGLIDVGGGMRDIYGAGVMDCFLDNGISFDVCIGVSAGSANIASFLAKQKGRNYRFFAQYASRKEYMGFYEFIKNGSYINLDYIYSYLSNSDSEDPLDFDMMTQSDSEFIIVATDGNTGGAKYFYKKDLLRDDFWLFKASCAMPLFADHMKGTAYATLTAVLRTRYLLRRLWSWAVIKSWLSFRVLPLKNPRSP